jgi:hypothetical protein
MVVGKGGDATTDFAVIADDLIAAGVRGRRAFIIPPLSCLTGSPVDGADFASYFS